jgi:transposase InsO family protein
VGARGLSTPSSGHDAASGYEPLAQPVQAADCEVASQALDALFREQGAPLVVKCDNGSAFRAAPVQQVLQDWNVFSLLSPPGVPQYNGTREARIGIFKARACWEAERNGHAGQWTSGDVEAARTISNQTPRHYQDAYIAPWVLWACRVPISQQEREAFASAVQACRQEAYSHYGLAADAALTAKQKDDVDRFAGFIHQEANYSTF